MKKICVAAVLAVAVIFLSFGSAFAGSREGIGIGGFISGPLGGFIGGFFQLGSPSHDRHDYDRDRNDHDYDHDCQNWNPFQNEYRHNHRDHYRHDCDRHDCDRQNWNPFRDEYRHNRHCDDCYDRCR